MVEGIYTWNRPLLLEQPNKWIRISAIKMMAKYISFDHQINDYEKNYNFIIPLPIYKLTKLNMQNKYFLY